MMTLLEIIILIITAPIWMPFAIIVLGVVALIPIAIIALIMDPVIILAANEW